MTERVTLITGASSGIGAATARKLAGPDECLMLHARGGIRGEKIPLLESVAADTRAAGARTRIVLSDLTMTGSGTALVESCIDAFGTVDRVVSNAGYAVATPVGELSIETLDESSRVITTAFLELMQAAMPELCRSNCGRVVAISSFVVDQAPGGRTFPATAAAKGALQALAVSLAAQLAPFGVTVNCVAPGFTAKETAGHSPLNQAAWQAAAEMTPNRKLARPEDIAHAVAFLLDEASGHITGQTLRVDGGLSLN